MNGMDFSHLESVLFVFNYFKFDANVSLQNIRKLKDLVRKILREVFVE